MINNKRCFICNHKNQKEIDDIILTGKANSVSLNKIYTQLSKYGLTRSSFYNHVEKHLCYAYAHALELENEDLEAESFSTKKGPKTVTAVIKKKRKEPSTDTAVIKKRRNALSINDMASVIQYCMDKSKAVIERSERYGLDDMLLRGVREVKGCAEIVIKAQELFMANQKKTDFDGVIIDVIKALDKFPEARAAVSTALDTNHDVTIN